LDCYEEFWISTCAICSDALGVYYLYEARHFSAPHRMKTSSVIALSVYLLLGFKSSAASFLPLGDLPGGNFFSIATGVSADGQVVTGYSSSTESGTSYEAFRWTSETGMIPLGDLPGNAYTSFAQAISADGSTIVGYSVSALGNEAFRWTQATGMVGLGDLPGGSFSIANAVSADGKVVVGSGTSSSSGSGFEAFRWTTADGLIPMGDLPGGSFDSRASAISADGSVIAGQGISSRGTEAYRWTAATGMVGLGDLPGGSFGSIAYGISADGTTILGYGSSTNSSHEAFRWRAETGFVPLGFIPCDTWSIARAASADGSVVVGDPQSTACGCVFIWDQQHGIRDLSNVLMNDYSLDVAGWQLCRATAVSLDGNTLVGYGINPSGQTEAWLANIAPPALKFARDGAALVLSWPAASTGFKLQSSFTLNPPVVWMDSPLAPTIMGSDFQVTTAPSNSMEFFRLKK
jgi:probable HAF family extracellular repeat protein